MNKIERIFSIPLWIGEVENKDSLNMSLLNSKIVKEKKFEFFNEFHGDFTTSYGVIEEFNEEWYPNLLSEIMTGFKEYVKTLTKKNKPLPESIEILNVWFNSYEKGQYQEPHEHLGYGIESPFSFIYYLKLPNKSPGKTVFVNDGYKLCENFYSPNLDVVTHSVKPDLTEGQYIIFPSFLTHFVLHHSSKDEQRMTVAGNIKLHYKDKNKGQ